MNFILKHKTNLLCVLGFAFFAFLMAYDVFVNIKSLSYPWWYTLGSDGDGVYVTQTLALMNNGDLLFVFHPGATSNTIHGLFYHVLGFFFEPYRQFTHLAQMPNPPAVFNLLDLAMRTSRGIALVIDLVCMLVFWRLLYQLTKSKLLSYLLVMLFMTTYFMMLIKLFIRADVLSFIFCVVMLSLALDLKKHKGGKYSLAVFWGVFIGVCAGFAAFAKIHVVPELVCVAAFWVFTQSGVFNGLDSKRLAVLAFIISCVNLLIMPWGWLSRPALLTDMYLQHFHGEEAHIYGTAPQTLAPIFWIILGAICVVSVFGIFKHARYSGFVQSLLKLSLMITGLIASCYFIFLPLGMKYASYWAASNHLLYATATSCLYGGALNHKAIDWSTVQRMIQLHSANGVFGTSIYWYVLIAMLGSILRICMRTINKNPYFVILFFIIIANVMDVLSSFRQYTPGGPIVCSYAKYSLSAYLCGIGIFISVESSNFFKRFGFNVQRIVCFILALHLWGVTTHLFDPAQQRSGRIDDQTPEPEMMNTISWMPTFWKIASHGQM